MSDAEAAAGVPRSRYLDVLRGIAILGILPANLPSFALPISNDDPAWVTGGGFHEVLVHQATRLLFDQKFITLFSLLFGAGLWVLRANAEAAGRGFAPRILRRLGFLWGAGVAHAVFLWWGDVLAYYAIFGLLCCWAGGWEPRWLRLLGVILILLPAVMLALAVPVLWIAAPEVAQPPDPILTPDGVVAAVHGSWGDFLSALDRVWDTRFVAEVYRSGSYARIMVVRTVHWAFMGVTVLVYYGWRIAGLFLIGLAWAKEGWLLRPEAHREKFRLLLRAGFVVGMPLQAASCALDAGGWGGTAGAVLAELAQYLGSIGLAAAYAGGVGLLCARPALPRGFGLLAKVGRTAFSNYLLQSVLCTFVFYSYGLGWFGRLDRLELLGVGLAVWGIQLGLTAWWMRHRSMGPLERLWRAVTNGEWTAATKAAKY